MFTPRQNGERSPAQLGMSALVHSENSMVLSNPCGERGLADEARRPHPQTKAM